MALTRPRAYQIYDIDYKQATRVVTVSNITLAGGAPNTVDSVSLAVNDRILVTGQSTASQNGIYVVATLGTGSNGTWIRSIDTDATGELLAGTIVMVTEGAVYQDTQWKLITNDPITIGVTGLTFVQNYSANSISSGTSNVTVLDSSSVLISSAGQANVVKVDAANITISANIIPSANVVYSLGTPTSRFKDLWISNNTIYLGNTTLESSNNSLFVNGAQVATVTAGDNLSLTGNLVASGNVTANGNVSGTYILGNVAFATGIPATYGNTNVADYLASGAVSSNIITTGNVSGTYILGNVAFATGIPATYSNTNVADYLASGAVSSNIITTGNVTGNYFLGNGSQLTGPFIGATTTASNTVPSSPSQGDVWIDTATGTQVIYFYDGTSNQWAEMEAAQSFSTGGSATVAGSNTQIQFNDSGSLGASGNLTFDKSTNVLSVAGNISGTYILGNGSQLTGVAMSWSIANSNITMSVNRGYFVDTSAGAKTMTLPASATIGDTIRINDLAGTFATYNLTVARNGGNIQGVAQDLLVDVDQSSFGLVYSNSTYGWKLLEI